MAIRFHLDENVSNAVAIALQRREIDVTTSADANLIGADDVEQLRFALTQRRVLVTHDDDFTKWQAVGVEHAGICYCPKDKHSIGDLLRLLLLVAACFDVDEMRCHIEFL